MGIKGRWKHTTIGEMIQEKEVSIQTGPFGTVLSASEYIKFGIPVISVREVRQGYIELFDETPSVSNETYNKMPQFNLYPDDLVFARKGSVDRSALIPNDGKKYFLGSDGIRQRFKNTILAKILLYCFQSAETKQFLLNNAYGTTMAGLNETIISQIPVSFPMDEKEQQAIANALSDIDKGTRSMEKLIAKKKAIKQGTMQQLLTGKTRLSNQSANWREERLGDVVLTSSGGTPSREVEEYYKGTIPWITTSELNDCHLYDSIEHITDEAVRNSSAKKFPRGTVLMAMYGATIGKLGILETESATNQACCAMMCTPEVNNLYLFYYLLFNREEIVSFGSGAGQPNISQTIVKNLRLRILSRKDLKEAVTDEDRLILELAELPDVYEFDQPFSSLFAWCQKTFARIEYLGGKLHEP